jgi:gliding motility-associated protein GldM
MINMMYLVLTALLALNVASEVLESFRVVNASLGQTINNVSRKNQQIYGAFDAAYQENPNKVKEWKEKADQVKEKTDQIINEIVTLKEKLALASGGVSLKNAEPGVKLTADEPYMIDGKGDTIVIKREDDLNTPSEILIKQKNGTELKEKINQYRNFLTSYTEAGSPLRENIEKQLDTSTPKAKLDDGGEKRTWEIMNFDNKPLIAIITLLSKIEIDIKNAENNVISSLYSQIDAASFKFNRLKAQVLAKSTYVLEGDPYEAQIFLAAEDTTQSPEVYVGNTQLPMKEGKGIYKVVTSKPGTFKWSGLIKYKTPEGNYNSYPFESEYQVGKPSVTISPTKMNVLYKGIPNPVRVSVPGVASENLEISVSNGRYEKDGEDYLVYPANVDVLGKNTSISVSAKIDGQTRTMGSMPFRVKEVPPPLATIAGLNGGTLRKEELMAEEGIFAELKDFDFDLKFKITQFDVSLTGAGGYVRTYKSASNKFTTEQKDQFSKLSQGSFIYIDNIYAKGDDGQTRPLSPVTFKVR